MTELRCKAVRLSLWDYAASQLPVQENAAVDAHLDTCRNCDRCLADVSSLRNGFRNLPAQAVPPLLATRLRVIASRERSRQLMRLNPALWLRDKFAIAMLKFDNLLRPYMVPATGGLLASCLCFSLIAHNLQLRPYVAGDDMPVGLFTEMAFDDVSPFDCSKKDVTVQLTVDAHGEVTDFSLPPGSTSSPDEQREIANLVLYSTYTPATRFGQRVSSKRLVAIRHIDVRD